MIKTITLVSFNIDGLPTTLDLNDLPWLLKPLAWIYKCFKGTTIIPINDNGFKRIDTERIGMYLSSIHPDVIGVQEDFNYHNELMARLDKEDYVCGKYLGGFELSQLFKKTEWLTYFPLPRFKCDGLNIIVDRNKIDIKAENNKMWKKSYGYFTHANDLLTHKGFRVYTLVVDNEIPLDVYIVHMDADFYNAVTCPDVTKDLEARESQLKQLVEYISSSNTNHPIIIMGDTNSYDKYEWDKANIQNNLISAVNSINGLTIQEAIPTNYSDCDKLFYVNNDKSEYKLSLEQCSYDTEIHLSDHFPLLTKLNIERK